MDNPKSKVFSETYKKYLAEIRTVDFISKADDLALVSDGEGLIIPLYDCLYRLDHTGITGIDGATVNPAIRVMICKYVLTWTPGSVQSPVSGEDKLMAYREFKDASPLISYFTNNTNKTLQTHFSGKLNHLLQMGNQLGAEELASDSYDVSLLFKAFPRIPVLLNFNDEDDMFPAVCSILYRQSAAMYLDMECLAMTGTLLAGRLLDSPRI